jgi:hypothetical protein
MMTAARSKIAVVGVIEREVLGSMGGGWNSSGADTSSHYEGQADLNRQTNWKLA